MFSRVLHGKGRTRGNEIMACRCVWARLSGRIFAPRDSSQARSSETRLECETQPLRPLPAEPRRARYLFHVLGDDHIYCDEAGSRFDSPHEAEAHALVVARELALDGDACRGFAVCVIDESGDEVARVLVGKEVSDLSTRHPRALRWWHWCYDATRHLTW